MPAIEWQDDDLVLEVHVQPRAGRNEVAGFRGDRLKIRISAPPVDGQANQQLIEFLADLFGVAKRDVLLLAGETGREKRFRIVAPRQMPGFLADFPARNRR